MRFVFLFAETLLHQYLPLQYWMGEWSHFVSKEGHCTSMSDDNDTYLTEESPYYSTDDDLPENHVYLWW